MRSIAWDDDDPGTGGSATPWLDDDRYPPRLPDGSATFKRLFLSASLVASASAFGVADGSPSFPRKKSIHVSPPRDASDGALR